GAGVYAASVIAAGQRVLQGWGPRLPRRTQHSFQVDLDTHILIPGPIELMNHSCDPNCGVLLRRGANSMEIYALRRSGPGEELTHDSATFEYEIEFMPEGCLCNSPRCRGFIGGYKDLPEALRRAYRPYIAEYLPVLEAALQKAEHERLPESLDEPRHV